MGPEDLCDGNLKLTLGLIWTLILRFQIDRGDPNSSAKNALLEWVRSMIPEYDIKNFTSDWQSGKAIYALANACEPGVIDPHQPGNDPLDNATRAFNAAQEKMGIPQVLDPVDMVESPDEHSNMLYINYFRDYLEKAKSREADERLRRTAVAGNCRAYGPGLEGGEALVPTEFTIEAVNAKGQICPCGGHPFNVKIKGPKDAVNVQLHDFENGTYKATYTPREAGTHSISVQLGDKHIPKSAFQVLITPPVADAAHTVAYGPGLEGGVTGSDAPFTVEIRNKLGEKIPSGGQNVGVKVKGPFAEIPANKTDNKNGTHSVTYRPLDVGEHTVEVTVDGKPIANSPFKLFVDAPEGSANWQNSYAAGPGLEDGNTTAEPAVYTIYTVDKNGNPVKKGGSPVSVEIVGPDGSPVDADVKDNNDGTYTVTYRPTEPGDYTVESILRNPFRPSSYEHIKNSPKTVHVEPGTDANNSYAYGPGLENGILDTLPTHFTVQAADRNGNKIKEGGDPFEVAIKDAKGNDVPIKVTDNNDGTYKVEYKPHGPGDHHVDVKLKGKPIKGAPYKVSVKAGASAHYSVVENYTFVIQAKTATGENRNEEAKTSKSTLLVKMVLLTLLTSRILEMVDMLFLTDYLKLLENILFL